MIITGFWGGVNSGNYDDKEQQGHLLLTIQGLYISLGLGMVKTHDSPRPRLATLDPPMGSNHLYPSP